MLLLSMDLRGHNTCSLTHKQHKMMGGAGASGPQLKLESISSALAYCAATVLAGSSARVCSSGREEKTWCPGDVAGKELCRL